MRKKLFRLIASVLCIFMISQTLPLAVYAAEVAAERAAVEAEVLRASTGAVTEDAEIISEVLEKREPNVKHYKMSDGSYATQIYPQNVHYEKDGALEEIDNSLKFVEDGDSFYYENTANSLRVKLPTAMNGEEPVEVSTSGHTIRWLFVAEEKSGSNKRQ